MKRYQILKRKARQPWEFVAHGAVYTDNEGCDIERLLAENGHATKRIPV